MENHLEDWVQKIARGETPVQDGPKDWTWAQRFDSALEATSSEILAKVWLYVVMPASRWAQQSTAMCPQDFMARDR